MLGKSDRTMCSSPSQAETAFCPQNGDSTQVGETGDFYSMSTESEESVLVYLVEGDFPAATADYRY